MLLKNSIIYILAKALPALAAFLALSIYTHLLSPEEYGLYTLIFTAAVFTHNTVFNWISMATMRFWSNKNYTDETFVSSIAMAYSKILLLMSVLLFISLFIYWNSEVRVWIFSGFILTITLAFFTIAQTFFNAQIKPEKYAILTIITSLSTLGLGVSLAYLGYGAIGIVSGMAIGFLLPSFIMSLNTWRLAKRASYDHTLFKKLLVYGLPLASAAVLEEFTKSADRFMLAALQDKAQAGMYAVGYDLSGNSIFMLMTAINLAAYPVIIKLLETESQQAAYDYFKKYTVLLLGIAIPAVIGLMLVGANLVQLVIGSEYHETVTLLLPWITLALLLLGLQVFYFDLAFQLGNYPMGIVKIGIFIALANLLLNYYLIPTMGSQGAAIATISSFALGSLLSLIFGRKHFKLPFPFADFIKIITATFVMGLCLWWLREQQGWAWLIAQLGVGILSYAIVIVGLDTMNLKDEVFGYLNKFIKFKIITANHID